MSTLVTKNSIFSVVVHENIPANTNLYLVPPLDTETSLDNDDVKYKLSTIAICTEGAWKLEGAKLLQPYLISGTDTNIYKTRRGGHYRLTSMETTNNWICIKPLDKSIYEREKVIVEIDTDITVTDTTECYLYVAKGTVTGTEDYVKSDLIKVENNETIIAHANSILIKIYK